MINLIFDYFVHFIYLNINLEMEIIVYNTIKIPKYLHLYSYFIMSIVKMIIINYFKYYNNNYYNFHIFTIKKYQ